MKTFATMCFKCLNCFQVEQEISQRSIQRSQHENDLIESTNLSDINMESSVNQVKDFQQQKHHINETQQQKRKREVMLRKSKVNKRNSFQNEQSADTTVSSISPEISKTQQLIKQKDSNENINFQLGDKNFGSSFDNNSKSLIVISKKVEENLKNLETRITKEIQAQFNMHYLGEASQDHTLLQFNNINNKSPSGIQNQISLTVESDQASQKYNDFCMQTPEEWSQIYSNQSTPTSRHEIKLFKKRNSSAERFKDLIKVRKNGMKKNYLKNRNRNDDKILLSQLSKSSSKLQKNYLGINSTQSQKKFRFSPRNYNFQFFNAQTTRNPSFTHQNTAKLNTETSERNRYLRSVTNQTPYFIQGLESSETLMNSTKQESTWNFQKSERFNSTGNINLLPIISEVSIFKHKKVIQKSMSEGNLFQQQENKDNQYKQRKLGQINNEDAILSQKSFSCLNGF